MVSTDVGDGVWDLFDLECLTRVLEMCVADRADRADRGHLSGKGYMCGLCQITRVWRATLWYAMVRYAMVRYGMHTMIGNPIECISTSSHFLL